MNGNACGSCTAKQHYSQYLVLQDTITTEVAVSLQLHLIGAVLNNIKSSALHIERRNLFLLKFCVNSFYFPIKIQIFITFN